MKTVTFVATGAALIREPSGLHLEVEGALELQRALLALPKDVDRKIRHILINAAKPLVRAISARMARAAIPHPERGAIRGRDKYGRFTRVRRAMGASHAADHIVATPGKSGFSIAVGPARMWWYWWYQEFGTVHHKAQPAIRPAFDEMANAISLDIQLQMWNEIWSKAQMYASAAGVTSQVQ